MIVCKDYKDAYETIEQEETIFYIFADLYVDTFPVNGVDINDILNLPQNRPLDKLRFASGSTLYCVDTAAVYIMNTRNEWKLQ